jgi:uncharacterized protein
MTRLAPLIALYAALALCGCAAPPGAPSASQALPDYRFGPSPFEISNWSRSWTTTGIEARAAGTVQGDGRQLVLRFPRGAQLRWVSGTRAAIEGVRFVLASSETGDKLGESRLIAFTATLRDDREVIDVPLPAELRIDIDREGTGRFSPPLANAYLRMELAVGRSDDPRRVHGPLTLFADLYTPGGHAAVCTRAATPAEAMLWNCATRLRELVDAGSDPSMVDAFMAPSSPENLTTPLEHAVASGDTALLRRLLHYGADPNHRGQDYSAFELAVVLGRVEALGPLLRHGGHVHRAGPHGYTPLLLAAQFNQPGSVRALLRAGADANQPVAARSPRGDGRTALMHALEEEKAEVLRLLLDAGADPLRPTADGFSPFLFASEHPRMHAFKEFLARGYPVNASTGQGFFAGKTPFMSVAVRSRPEDLEELLRLGADPRLADRTGHDAIYWARRFGREDNAQWIERRLASGG